MATVSNKTKMSVLAVSCVLFLFLSSGSLTTAEQAVKEEKTPDTIKVEVRLVQISNRAAHKAGVALIPQNSSESISIDKINKCLKDDKDKSAVLSAMNFVVSSGRNARSQTSNTKYIQTKMTNKAPDGKDVKMTSCKSFDYGTNLNIRCANIEKDKIYTDIHLSYNGITKGSEDKMAEGIPADTIRYSLEEMLYLTDGQPCIIGGTSYGDALIYTIVRAETVK